jgi:hypothetical protein
MHERWIRAALAAVTGSLISICACNSGGDDAVDPSKLDAGASHAAGASPDTGGSHDAGASGPMEQEPIDAGANASVEPDAGAPSARDVAATHFCRADCNQDQPCPSAANDCEPACVTKTERWAADFLNQLTDCIEGLGCDENDSCFGDALSSLYPDFADDPVVGQCGQLSNDCAFDENLCPSLLVLSAEAQPKAMNCLSLECKDDIGACLTSAGAFSP